MKEISRIQYPYIPNWKNDMQQLIRLRHIRNDLAHRENAFQDQICTQEDINWIRNFYERILNRSDPIAMLHRKAKADSQTMQYINKVGNDKDITKSKKNAYAAVIRIISIITVFFFIAVICAAIMIFIYMFS